MKALDAQTEVYLWLGATDMRAGFERQAQLVQDKLGKAVIGGGVYVFVSRCKRRMKLLYWDADGFALWYKRLEAGTFCISQQEGAEVITGVDLLQLPSGVDLSRIVLKKNPEKGLYSRFLPSFPALS
jgi:transposase